MVDASQEGKPVSSNNRAERSGDAVGSVRPASHLRSVADGFGEIYPQLRSMATAIMRQERASHTLQPTAVVNEAFMRLAKRDPSEFQTINNLLAVSASTMRCILVDHARSRSAVKRGANRRVGDAALAFVAEDRLSPADILAVNEALDELGDVDARQAKVVECKVFAGMTVSEIADALGVARVTVNRDWRLGRAFLALKLGIVIGALDDVEGQAA